VTVLCGLGLVLVLGLVADGLGRAAVWAAALFTAVSPAMVYYSRYFIHEPVLVLATAVFLGAAWRFAVHPGLGWAALSGAGLGLMWATKETFVFALGAAAVAALATVAGGTASVPDSETRVLGRLRRAREFVGWQAAAVFFLVAGGVGGLLLTSFGSNPGGVIDAVRTYFVWGERAGGETPHVQPWYFYFGRLAWFHGRGAPVWSEALILGLALVGAGAAFRARSGRVGGAEVRLVRFVAVYTGVLAAGYSAIPYKTPWCLLGFLHGLVVLAGVGTAVVAGAGASRTGRTVGRGGWRAAVAAGLVLGGAIQLSVQAWRGSREYAADYRNPYVYGHTSADFVNLLDLVRELAGVHPEGEGMPVQVVVPGSGYWPLPWYLRRFRAAGWWETMPEPPDASVVIVAVKLAAALDAKTGQAWRPAGMFELRPRYFVEVYVEAELWKRFLAARAAAHAAEP
jgi:uncharacterized protein (TIGR03663 family)